MSEETLGGRFTIILEELNMPKAAFARSVGITPNYVYLLESGKVKSCSRTLALLIERLYGYSADWIMTGGTKEKNLSQTVADRMKGLDDKELRKISSYLDKLQKGDEE